VKKIEKCEILNLSYNRINGENIEPLYDMLKSEVGYVCLVDNAIATIDCKELLNSFPSDYFKKLILVPQSFLKGNQWRRLVDGEEIQKIIEDTHKKIL